MPLDERPSKEDEKEDPSTDKEPQEGQEGAEENDHGKGRKLSKDFKDRWERLEQRQEEPEKEAPPPEPKPVGLGLFKSKMNERKGQKAKGGFLTPALADAAKKAVAKGRQGQPEKGPGPKPIPPPDLPKPGTGKLEAALQKEERKLEKEVDILDNIISDLKGHREVFLQRRKEELKKDSERPRTDPEPYISKLKVIKEEMEKKRKEEAAPDIFGVGFTAKQKDARVDTAPSEERKKSALKESMEKAIKKGSILKRLDQVLIEPVSAIMEESEDAKVRLLKEIGQLDTKGFEGRVEKLLSKIKMGKVFQAERDLLNLKIAMEAQRSREQLKREREERLESHLQTLTGPSKDLEDVVGRHIKALEIEMDQTKARVNRDLKHTDTTGFEHVVSRINDMLEEDRAFDAEEQLLELKLALKARELREELKTGREERILEKAKASMPVPEVQSKPVMPLVESKMDLLEEIEEAETPQTIGEIQCGVCGTILTEGAKACPACGTSFTSHKADSEEGKTKETQEPELLEIQCGICGSVLPEGAKRCRACGTLLVGPEPPEGEHETAFGEPEEYPSLAPIEEKESYPELGPIEEEEAHPGFALTEEQEAYPLLAPIEEKESYPVLAPIDEEEQLPQVVPGKGMRCPNCSKFSPIDSITCVSCGASLGLPILEPVEAEEGVPELVPLGPEEEATEELATEEGVPVADLEEEIVGEPEVEPEGVEEQQTEGVETVEGVPWSEVPPEADKELEWRRLCVRAKRFFNEGRVKAALESYDDAIEITPSFDAYYGKGEALLSLGWTNSALDCFNQALEINDERPQGWLQKAKALETLGKYSDAIDSVNRALAIDDMSSEAWHLKGTMLLQMGQVEEAVRALDKYVGIKPSPEALREAVEMTKKAVAKAAEEPEEAELVEAASVKGVAPEEELAAVEEEELGSLRATARTRRYKALAKQRGLTNGFALVNGRGMTNGRSLVNGRLALVNGRSKVNGMRGMTNGTKGITNGKKGLINGRGLVNGASGLVNGRVIKEAADGIPAIRFKRARRAKAMQAVGILAIVLLAIFAPLVYFYLNPGPTGILIDGSFQDWNGINKFQDVPKADIGNPDITISSFTIKPVDDSVYFYVQVSGEGKMLNGRDKGVDILRVFLDTDLDPMTGYSIGGLGADRMLEVYGWYGHVQSANVLSFNTSRSSDDWNGWTEPFGIQAAVGSLALEAQVSDAALGPIAKGGPQALFVMSDTQGHKDTVGTIISGKGGSLLVELSQIGTASLAIGQADQALLALNLTAQNANENIASMSFYISGDLNTGIDKISLYIDNGDRAFGAGDTAIANATPSANTVLLTPDAPLTVLPRSPLTMFVVVSLAANAPKYTTLGLGLDRSGVSVSAGTVTVSGGEPVRRYVGAVPTQIKIDGAFDDWSQVSSNADKLGDVSVPSLDLRDYRTTSDGTLTYFYTQTTGPMMYGSFMPGGIEERPIPGPPNPGPPTPPAELGVLKGQDALLILIDTDSSNSTGYRPNWTTIGADYEIKVLGKGGKIDSAELFSWGATGWAKVANIPADKGLTAIELGVSKGLLGLGPTASFKAVFFMSDWDGTNCDASDGPVLGDPALALVTDGSGKNGGDQFGYSVANAGDVNGDGYNDIIVGAPYNDNNVTDGGSAYIFFGRATFNTHNDLNASKANIRISGLTNNGHFSWSVAGAGDLNGDGIKDVIIGEPDSGPGHAYIFYGYKSWKGNFTTAKANVSIAGETNKDQFGFSVAGPGNVDKSGNDDVLVGAPKYDQLIGTYTLLTDDGRAYVFYGDGSISNNATGADVHLDGEYSFDNFGHSVAGAGDVNKDTYPDIIIGGNSTMGVGGANVFLGGSLEDTVIAAQMTNSGVTYAVDTTHMVAQAFTPKTSGRVRFVDIAASDTGANSPPAGTPQNIFQVEIQTDNNGAPSGVAISSREGGDFAQWQQASIDRFVFSRTATVNANTRYWIVATCLEAAGAGYGWLYRQANVYAGGYPSTWVNNVWTAQNSNEMMFNALVWPDVVYRGENPGDGFGYSVDGAGDLNKDGFYDVIVGAPYNDNAGNNAGRVYIYNGSASMADNIFASVVAGFPIGVGLTIDKQQSVAQSFTSPAAGTYLTHIWWAGFEAVNAPANPLTIALQKDVNGAPSGVNLWSWSGNPGVNANAQESFWLDLELNPHFKLAANSIYWIVATSPLNNNNQGFAWFEQTNNPYLGGNGAHGNNGGKWTNGAYDLLFMVRSRADARITGGAAGDNFGFSVAGVGDINKDGKDDIAVGAPYADNGNTADCGAVYTFLGPMRWNNTAANANYTNYGTAASDHFGWSVDGGDVNKDGYSELIVGAPGYDKPAQDAGQASVWRIPEFKDVVIPLLGMMTIIIFIQRKKRAVRKKGRVRT